MRRLGAFLLLLGVVAGCGGESKPVVTARTDIQPDAQARAERIVLRIADLPQGWRGEADDDDPSNECVSEGVANLTINGRAKSDTFYEGDSTVALSLASVFQDQSQAEEALRLATSPETLDCLQDGIEGTVDDDEVDADSSRGEFSFPQLGDESRAFQVVVKVSADGSRASLYFDLVFVRRDRALALVMTGNGFTTFDRELERRLTALVAERMK